MKMFKEEDVFQKSDNLLIQKNSKIFLQNNIKKKKKKKIEKFLEH